MKAYRIVGWAERYEVNFRGDPWKDGDDVRKSRMKYIRSQLHGYELGTGYRRLKHCAGDEFFMIAFGVFHKLLELSGDQEWWCRGYVLDEKQRVVDGKGIAFIIDVPVLQVEKALEVLCEVGWIEEVEVEIDRENKQISNLRFEISEVGKKVKEVQAGSPLHDEIQAGSPLHDEIQAGSPLHGRVGTVAEAFGRIRNASEESVMPENDSERSESVNNTNTKTYTNTNTKNGRERRSGNAPEQESARSLFGFFVLRNKNCRWKLENAKDRLYKIYNCGRWKRELIRQGIEAISEHGDATPVDLEEWLKEAVKRKPPVKKIADNGDNGAAPPELKAVLGKVMEGKKVELTKSEKELAWKGG